MHPPIITIPQDRETEASRESAPGRLAFTVVYARSRDTRAADASGQDFIAYCYDESRIAFAVCDGVSQSFYGEIAARFLGLRLVDTLWNVAILEPDSAPEPFLADLDAALHSWTDDATAEVQAKVINPALPEMHRIALQRKRDNGSESMFVAGVIDRHADRLALCWMGDMRLWLWDAEGQPIEIPGADWQTRERWSSRLGPKNGSPRGVILPLATITRITAHSDGVGSHAAEFAALSQDQLNSMVGDLEQAASSDDVSVLDIDLNARSRYGEFSRLAAPVLRLPDPAEPVLTWEAVPLAARYRVLIDDGHLPYTRDVTGTTYFPPYSADMALTCAVQALNDYTFPSAWSAPIRIEAEAREAAFTLHRAALTPSPLPYPNLPQNMGKEHPEGEGSQESPLPPAPSPEGAGESIGYKVADPYSGSPAPPGEGFRVRASRPRRKKSRLAAFLTVLISALLLVVLIVAVWIAAVIIGWNDLVQLNR